MYKVQLVPTSIEKTYVHLSSTVESHVFYDNKLFVGESNGTIFDLDNSEELTTPSSSKLIKLLQAGKSMLAVY